MKYFDIEEVKTKTLSFFEGDELATNVWIEKYCLKDSEGKLLESSPEDMFIRLATEFHRIEKEYPNPLSFRTIYWWLKNMVIIPGGSILYGVGNNYSYSSLGNCFVIGTEADSYGGIFRMDEEQVHLMKRRAGVGHDLSHIRPKGALTSNSSKTSTGIVPFMERYSNSTREVAQEGRRGALMLTININHPEILNFISAKSDLSKITGANVSVKVTDEFMEAVLNDTDYTLSFKEDYKVTMPAKKIWQAITNQAWESAEPGVLFWDRIIRESPADCYEGYKTTSTNPCGEIPLCPYDSCRLLSVNLYAMVDKPFTNEASFDFDIFRKVVGDAQKLMDDIIDLEREKITEILEKIQSDPEDDEIKQTEKNLWEKIGEKLVRGRRTGLSAIGLADVLAALGFKYGEQALNFAEEIYKEFAIAAYSSSIQMAKDRKSFPIFDYFREENNPFIQRILGELSEEMRTMFFGYGRRNISLLTIPPSGTISMLPGITSGIEPVFSVIHKRRRKVHKDHPKVVFVDKTGISWEEYLVIHRTFLDWCSIKEGDRMSHETLRELLSHYTSKQLEELIDRSPYRGSAAHEIDYNSKVRLQGRIQKWIDHSISVTHNMPKTVSQKEVSDLMLLAYKEGCKGVTIYRDGSRDGVLLTNTETISDIVETTAPKRPKDVVTDIFYPTIKGEEYLVLIGILGNKPYEVFCFKNRQGFKAESRGLLRKVSRGFYNLMSEDGNKIRIENVTSFFEKPEEEFATRAISTALRHGTPVRFIVEQLNKAEGELFSYSKVIARTLKKYIPDGITISSQTCPQCGHSSLIYVEGCMKCNNCEWSKCN